MADMIDLEYREEAMKQEQEGGAWHSVIRSGKALSWDKLLEKLQRPAVDQAFVEKPAPEKAPEPTPSSSKKRPADATESQAAATKKKKAKSPAPGPEAPAHEPEAPAHEPEPEPEPEPEAPAHEPEPDAPAHELGALTVLTGVPVQQTSTSVSTTVVVRQSSSAPTEAADETQALPNGLTHDKLRGAVVACADKCQKGFVNQFGQAAWETKVREGGWRTWLSSPDICEKIPKIVEENLVGAVSGALLPHKTAILGLFEAEMVRREAAAAAAATEAADENKAAENKAAVVAALKDVGIISGEDDDKFEQWLVQDMLIVGGLLKDPDDPALKQYMDRSFILKKNGHFWKMLATVNSRRWRAQAKSRNWKKVFGKWAFCT